MYECPKCKSPFEKGTKFCKSCGCNLEKEFLFSPVCPQCRNEFPDGTQFCNLDGSKLTTRDKLVPRCVKCEKEYPPETQYCSIDGAPVIPEALRGKSLAGFRQSSPERLAHLISDGYELKISEYFSRGWEIYKQNVGGFIGYLLLFGMIMVVLNLVLSIIPLLGNIVAAGLMYPFVAGLFIVALKLHQGEEVEFSDFLKGFDHFQPLFLAGMLIGTLTFIGFLFLLVPGVYLAIGYYFTIPLITHGGLDFWQAMETSRKLITTRWFQFFVFVLLIGLLNMAGALALGLGIFVTAPLSICAVAAAYEDIVGTESIELV